MTAKVSENPDSPSSRQTDRRPGTRTFQERGGVSGAQQQAVWALLTELRGVAGRTEQQRGVGLPFPTSGPGSRRAERGNRLQGSSGGPSGTQHVTVEVKRAISEEPQKSTDHSQCRLECRAEMQRWPPLLWQRPWPQAAISMHRPPSQPSLWGASPQPSDMWSSLNKTED